jgi:hypothetical protein
MDTFLREKQYSLCITLLYISRQVHFDIRLCMLRLMTAVFIETCSKVKCILLFVEKKNNIFTDLKANFATFCFNRFCWNLINTWLFLSFKFSVVISNSKALGSGTSGYTVCI